MRKVVGATDEAGFRGAVVVRREGTVDIRGALGGLNDDEAGAAGVGGCEVDSGLVGRDIEALDRSALGDGCGVCEGEGGASG